MRYTEVTRKISQINGSSSASPMSTPGPLMRSPRGRLAFFPKRPHFTGDLALILGPSTLEERVHVSWLSEDTPTEPSLGRGHLHRRPRTCALPPLRWSSWLALQSQIQRLPTQGALNTNTPTFFELCSAYLYFFLFP